MSYSKTSRTKSEYRRGFKTEADELARELRAEFGLRPEAPLDPFRLAEHLLIPLDPLSSLMKHEREAVRFLMSLGRGEFSAATVFKGPRRRIVFNDAHAPVRQNADVAHELAHGLLMHPPGPPLTDDGCRNYDCRLEAEASWLGPALLVSKEAALDIAWKSLPLARAAQEFGVSEALMRMRLNVTGAEKIARRMRRKRSGGQ